jgi:hypothetical protein
LSFILLTPLLPKTVSNVCLVHFARYHSSNIFVFIAGGWVGLSDIVSVGGGKFLLVERDNQGGPDAAIKRIYSVSLGNLGAVVDGSTVTKLLVWDVLPDVSTAIGGLALEKIEGIAVLNGDIWINTDNDGLSDSSGESRLIKLGKVPK